MHFHNHFLTAFLATSASATVLVKYSAAAGDSPSALGLQNLEGWDFGGGKEPLPWPDNQPQNASVYFKNAKDPDGIAAAHVHKDYHFRRSEYHCLNKKTEVDTTYYIGYKVRFDNVDFATKAFQWKSYYDASAGYKDVIPAALIFRKDADGKDNHTIHFEAQTVAKNGNRKSYWTKALTMGKTYTFGIVVNTSRKSGYMSLYFNGKPATFLDPDSQATAQELEGDFYPDRADPKFGLYDGANFKACDSWVYDVVIGTELKDIADVVGIVL
ncbi:hypothetical protein BCR34DRAFT_596823 [Clohesyomyces aquaticus]|uniref:Concanavalin A-like lectin/glucanase domain-containing protein n=1 Tax=Clohesyomyces aquaticus TaxID=1231657 RepID=A0A1Y2A563_9PLEO|nr:hypothetical protein BCR34DRAFT_596823 [Clohesyomyces aquaticus]